ncbi:hypothetical protein BC829DRAFT_416493 [Chytridium lagenaria]|nr:hypothetical protein BC829DRAFT_416493 [Chytridium lagenaria]
MDSSPYKFRPFQHHPSSHSKLNILPAPPGSTPNFNGRPPLSNIGQSMATPSSSAMRDVKTMVGSSGSVNIFRGRGTVQVQVKPKHDEKKHTEVIKPPILPRISPRKTIVVDKKGGKSPPYSSPTVFIKGDPSHAILQRHLARTAGLVNKTSKPRKGRKNDEVIDLSSPPKLTTSKTFAKLSESFDNVASSPPRPSPSKTAGRQSANLSVSLSPWKISPKTSLQDALKENDDARREEKAKAQTETNPSTTLAVRNVPSKAHKKRKHEVIAHDDKQGEGRVLRKRVDHGLIDHVYKTRRSGRLLAEALAGRNRLRDLI